ncbi:MAG: DoxX family protein [Bacteroidaceae bacterium]|nr:DoxX family protein [Bacteroidaceae bacterium]
MRINSETLPMKVIVNACRLLLAVTFILSGFLKADDPLGTVYKMQDYLASFGINNIPGLALVVVAIALSFLEFTIGINLLFGISRRPTARMTAVFMMIMTAFTVYIFIFDPVKDCGCFGDAIILTNGQTLLKNIILLTAALIITKWHFLQIEFVSDNIKWLISTIGMLYLPGFAIYCIINLPMFDFRPYKIGTDLRAVYEATNSAPSVNVKIIYEKNGKTIELEADDDDPDSTWHYVETRREIKNEKQLQTSAFFVQDAEETDITEDIVFDEGYSFLLIIPNLKKSDEGCIDLVNEIYEYSIDNNYAFYCITGSEDEKSQIYWNEHTGAEYPFYTSDERELKTIVRASPGLVLLHDGKIVGKWSNHNLPDEYILTDRLENIPIGKIAENSTNKKMGYTLMMFIIPLLILTIIDRSLIGWKFYREMKRKSKDISLGEIDKRLMLDKIEKKISDISDNIATDKFTGKSANKKENKENLTNN